MIEEQSDPQNNQYAFSYTVTITNSSAQSVQLLERHWIVLSAERQIAEVVGPGVVGLQPVIEPGEQFSYTSGTVIEDPVGSMYGTYTFRSSAGSVFQADIPKFDLLYPAGLN